MNISMIGTGYVGLVAAVCFADAGHKVTCVDLDQRKIDLLNHGKVPIYEPGLEELMSQSRSRLKFTTDFTQAVQDSSVVFIAVGTPATLDGNADLKPTMKVIRDICSLAHEQKKFVVLKSTVPVGTAEMLKDFCRTECPHPIEIISNPEFLKEGAAIDDFLRPDRVVIGCSSKESEQIMLEIYEPFVRNGKPILMMDNTSAEMTKYAANAFLSVKISFINELALLADQLGADINQVRRGFTADSRINPAFFHPGIGFGGSCFPKDVQSLIQTGQKVGIPMDMALAADQVNRRQKLVLYERLKMHFGELKDRTIAIWGLSFKPRTDDVREAPALDLIEKIVGDGACVRAYDPVAMENTRSSCSAHFQFATSAMEAVKDADALLIVTEWSEFRNPDLHDLKKFLKHPVVLDGRNVLDPRKMKDLGFDYFCIGRQVLSQPSKNRYLSKDIP